MKIVRVIRSPYATLGELSLPGVPTLVLRTLEDPPGHDKGPIPVGRYPISLTYSDRFQMLLPEVESVPGFTGIRLHAGNAEIDTKGCILVGMYQVSDREIAASRVALGKLLTVWRSWEGQVLEIVEEFDQN